jgi:trehalose 6-phosphate phosphatase
MTTPPEAAHDWALFLDVDGTLVHIAEHPESVQPPDRLKQILENAAAAVDGALALISGRSIDAIDRLTGRAAPAAAGLHGLEIRTADGQHQASEGDTPAITSARERLQTLVKAHPDLYLEDKKATVALHYRGAAKGSVSEAERLVDEIVDASDGVLARLAGKSVYEIKPADGNKGDALRALMATAPFSGRRPVYIGDDVTDEAGFSAVNALDGISIRVGDNTDSVARYQLDTVDEVLEWLETTAATLKRPPPPPT